MTPGADVFDRLVALDHVLVSKGFPALSGFWRDTFRLLLTSGKRTLVVRAGRRAGKSSSLCRFVVALALYGGAVIPPGDTGVAAFISVSRDESAQRLRTIAAILDALGVPYSKNGDALELRGRPIVFKTYAASVAGVSGFTAVAVIADEVAKWRDVDTGTNPATAVLASVRPTMATQPSARMVLSSSPWSTIDAHHEAFSRGDTPEQVTAWAPTWVANPSISEADTHALEPDAQTHAREYGAEPMNSGSSAFFDHDSLDAAIDVERFVPSKKLPASCGVDPAFRSDAAAAAVVLRDGPLYRVVAVEEQKPAKGAPLKPSDVVGAFAALAKRYGATCLTSDGYYSEALREAARAHSLSFQMIPSGAEGKADIFTATRDILNAGRLRLPPGEPGLVRALKSITFKPLDGGLLKISAPRRPGSHADTASALVAGVWAASKARSPIKTTPTADRRLLEGDETFRTPGRRSMAGW